MSVEDNISLMRRWYREVWREGKNQTIYELLASDASLRGQAGPEQEIRGPEGFVAFADQIRNALPDTELSIEDIFAVDDKVAVRWVATGTHTGDGLGFPPSYRRLRISGITIARVVNGKIVEAWDHWDRLGMLEQIGAYKQPEAAILGKSA
jgi:steroid delta-isomerase-like uncharacterized protein